MKLKDYLEQKYGTGENLQEFLSKYGEFKEAIEAEHIDKPILSGEVAYKHLLDLQDYMVDWRRGHIKDKWNRGEETWGHFISCALADMVKLFPKVEPLDNLNFGQAIEALKKGKCVTRKGWNDKEKYLRYNQSHPVDFSLYPKVTGEGFEANEEGTIHRNGQMLSHIVMTIAGDSKSWGSGYSDYVPWEPSQIDMFAEDWEIVKVIPTIVTTHCNGGRKQ